MFGFKTLGDTNELINHVASGNYNDVKKFVESKNYSLKDLNIVLDCYFNNVLSISVMNSHVELVKYFLNIGIDYNKINKFKQSAWDLAIIYKNKEIIDLFVNHKMRQENTNILKINELVNENENLRIKTKELKRKIECLEITSCELERKNSNKNKEIYSLQNEIVAFKASNKRLREDVIDLTLNNKKLKDENVILTEKNQKLKTSVETLMNNSKK